MGGEGGTFLQRVKGRVLNEDIHLLTNPFSVFFEENVGNKTYLLENKYNKNLSKKC